VSDRPTVGRIVHYRMAAGDIETGAPGYGLIGLIFPAIVVGLGGPGEASLFVFLPDTATAYVHCRVEGDAPGTWRWPQRLPEQAGSVDAPAIDPVLDPDPAPAPDPIIWRNAPVVLATVMRDDIRRLTARGPLGARALADALVGLGWVRR